MKKDNLKKLDLDIFEEKLPNGLQIIVVPLKNVNNIYATFSTKFGSNEIEFSTTKNHKVPLGIAHFLEHKLFAQKDGIDPFTFYSSNGCDCNANTNNEKTTYLFAGPDNFKDNLNYLLDYVQEPYFTDENVDKEKGIINQEIKMYMDDPESVMYEKILENTFNEHPLKYSILGDFTSIKNMNKEDLYLCYNTFYNPSNMFLIITGNIEAKEVINIVKENQINKDFKKDNNFKRKTYIENDKVSKEHEVIKLNISIPRVAIGIKIKITLNDLYKNFVYISMLFNMNFGSTSLFNEKLINNKLINFNLNLDYITSDNHILYLIEGETKEPEKLVNEIKNKLKNLDFLKSEFERSKKGNLSSLIYLSDNLFNLNEYLMNQIIRYGSIDKNRHETISSLDFDDFKKFVTKINLDNITTFVVEPK